MFKKDKADGTGPGTTPDPQTDNIIAFIGKGVEFKGSITYDGTVRVDGSLEGEIHTSGALLVGEEAVITARISAGAVVCKGRMSGDVLATQKVRLLAPAVFHGSVRTPVFSIEEGVTFDGTCEMTATDAHESAEESASRPMTTLMPMKRANG